MSSFSLWDVAFSLIVFVSTIIGFRRGFVVDTVATVVFFLGVFVGIAFGTPAGEMLLGLFTDVSSTNPWTFWVGLVVIFIVIMILGTMIRNLFEERISEIGMRSADKMIGLAMGLVRGFLLVMLLIALLQLDSTNQADLERLFFYDLLEPFNESVRSFVDFLINSEQASV